MSASKQYRKICPGEESPEMILNRYDSYLVLYVQHVIKHRLTGVNPLVLDLEVDDLTQRTRIKFWHALLKNRILYPRIYIRRIAHSEFIDMLRRRKNLYPLQAIEEQLLSHIPDPAEGIERQTVALACLEEVIQDILRLPRRQRMAMFCSLYEHADDLNQLRRILQRHGVCIDEYQWPADKAERQLLQASLSVARRTIMQARRARAQKSSLNNEMSGWNKEL